MHNYFYDAESRLIQVDGSLGDCSSTTTLAHATACYYCDARGSGFVLANPEQKNGRRVWRTGYARLKSLPDQHPRINLPDTTPLGQLSNI